MENNWKEYYFNYQKTLADKYYIPLLRKLKIKIKDKETLDVGCGDGGFISAFSESGTISTGVEIKNFNWPQDSNVKYIIGDIVKNSDLIKNKKFDIIILRDVIEHIDNKYKYVFLNNIKGILNHNGIILITFPPYLSPFGLHQQVFCKSILKYTPFLSLLPWIILKKVLLLFGEDENTINEIKEINKSGMKINAFLNLVYRSNLTIHYKKYFLIRPSHQLRYGLRVINSYFGGIPIIREIFTTGTIFILKKD